MEILVQTPPPSNHLQNSSAPNSPSSAIMNQQTPSHELSHHQQEEEQQQQDQKNKRSKGYMALLVMNYIFLFLGSVSSSLLSKYYFNHKGSSRWVSTWVQSAGFPLLLVPILVPYYLLKCTQRKPFTHFTPRILVLSLLIGLALGINNLLFSWGNSYLPVSTSALLLSSQLVFNLIFSVIIVKQKLSFTNLNCVILLTLSSVLLALSSSHDRPHNLTQSKYLIGFFSTIGAGLLFALYLPVMETVYKKVYCYSMVMEMQLVMEVAATALATVGMAFTGGYKEMKRESVSVFDVGPKMYWVAVMGNVVTWQLCFMGTAGMVFLTSSLTGGICMTAILAMNVVAGVAVYGDSFGGVKAVSTVLCGWGFCSYVYGMYMKTKKEELEEKMAREIGETANENGADGDGEKYEIVMVNPNNHHHNLNNHHHNPNHRNQGMEMVNLVTVDDRV